MPDDSGARIQESTPFGEFGGLQGLMNMMNQLFGTGGSETSDSNSPEGMAAAQQLFQLLMPDLSSNDFSPEAATRDAQAGFSGIFRQMAESGVPLITGQENASGGYNSTSAGLLKNDLATRIGESQNQSLINTKTKYAAAQQGKVAQILALIKTIADAHRTQAINRQTQGLVDNTNARRAAAAAAAAAALKAITNKSPNGGKPEKPGGGGGGGGKKPADNEKPAGADYKDSGRETEEDARNSDPNYDPNSSGDESAGLDLGTSSGDESAGLDMNGDPFGMSPDSGSSGDESAGLDFNLGDLGNLDFGDLFGDNTGGDGADFTFPDLGNDGFDWGAGDVQFGEPMDGGGGGGDPFFDEPGWD